MPDIVFARIDLTEWETNPESTRYLTFLKGRVGRKVADFFMDFLGASEGLNAKAQNRGLCRRWMTSPPMPSLINPSDRTCASRSTPTATNSCRLGKRLNWSRCPKSSPASAKRGFRITAEQGYELEESSPADRSTLRQLTKFAGSGGGLTINFDAMLLGERVFWDPATDTLTIKGTPPNLRDQLQRPGRQAAIKPCAPAALPLNRDDLHAALHQLFA